ncbi:MAG: alpha-keto acid decarboxylase family protein [Alphaproteobacteria bacterium]|nr:alpha-keto acid decarboxylase family protein [Alphaproteobacteria bacterium]
MSAQQHTVGSFLFDYLHRQGVGHVFGIPGDFALPTFRWMQASPIDIITMTHEPSVGFAADAYARIHGLGVACVTYCVGGLNMLNSVACAYAEKSPLLVLSGGPSPADRTKDVLMHHKVRTFDTQRRIYEEVTCATAVLLDPETAAGEIMRVVDTMREQSLPGYIEIPFDVVDMPIGHIPAPRNKAPRTSDPENLVAMVEDAIAAINGAKQPVIIADIELHRYGLEELALEVASKFNIPVASTLLSKSIISETHPLFIGVYSGPLSDAKLQSYVEESDCIIMLGAYITDVWFGFMNTSEKLRRKNTMICTTEKMSIGYRSYEHVVLKELLERLLAAPIKPRQLSALPKPAPEPEPLTDKDRNQPVTMENFFRILGLSVGENDTITCDTGDSLFGAMKLRTRNASYFLADAYYLSMGFAVPAAIGAMAARPDNRVFAIVGDGAFQMTGIELSTAVKFGMKPIVFVINNDGYGTQRFILDGPFNEILRWNYTKLTDLFGGGMAYKVTTNGELETAIQAALKDDQMYLIEVVIPRNDCSPSLKRVGEELGKLRDKDKRSA